MGRKEAQLLEINTKLDEALALGADFLDDPVEIAKETPQEMISG